MTTKRFVTLHPVPVIDPGFLNRDVGQIGQTLKKELGYMPEVWWLPVPGKAREFTLEDQIWISAPSRIQLFRKLWKEAKSIDVLHLYHIWHFTFLFALVYKMRNPYGKIYVKLDCPFLWKNDIAFIFTRVILLMTDWIWVEDKRFIQYFIEKYPSAEQKFIFTPSWAIQIDSYIWKIQKKKQIALVGRFGDPIKNYELFLDVLESGNRDFLKEYTLYFIGWYTPEFRDRLTRIQEESWLVGSNIILTGFLQNKQELYDILRETEIFIHTSNHEWDPNIQYDAMFCGCYMISTDVGNISQNYPKQSSSFYAVQDPEGLRDTISHVIRDPESMTHHNPWALQKYCIDNFVWKESLAPLISKL